MSVRQFVFLGAMTSAMVATAQEACPGGTQVGQNCGGGYCVPICAYDDSSQSALAPPPRVVERWEVFDDRFGAIALASSGHYGTSFNRSTKEDAESAALLMCAERGGKDCELKSEAHRNSCTTFAWGGGRFMVDGASTPELSEKEALAGCEADAGVKCDVIETFCSTPVSRWVYEKPDNWVPAQE